MKQYTGREEFLLDKPLCGIGHIELSLAFGSIDAQRILEIETCSQRLCHADAENAIIHISHFEFILSVAHENAADMGEAVEIVFHSLDPDHGLAVFIDSESVVFERLRSHCHLFHRLDFQESRVISRHGLSLDRSDLQLRVERGEKGCHKVMEAIEHTERHHQGHGGYCHTGHADAADDVDGICALFGEEIPARDVEGEIHAAQFFFSSSSMRSI